MGDHIVGRKPYGLLIRVMRNTRGYPPDFSGWSLFSGAGDLTPRPWPPPRTCRKKEQGTLTTSAPNICGYRVTMSAVRVFFLGLVGFWVGVFLANDKGVYEQFK